MLGRPRDDRGDPPTLSDEVLAGFASAAVRRACDDPPDPDEVTSSVTRLRSFGETAAADVLELVTSDAAARALVAPPWNRFGTWLQGSFYAGMVLSLAVLWAGGPQLDLVGIVGLPLVVAALGARWVGVRWRRLDDRSQRIVRSWWWRERTGPAVSRITVLTSCALGLLVGVLSLAASAEGGPVLAVVLLVVGVILVAVPSWLFISQRRRASAATPASVEAPIAGWGFAPSVMHAPDERLPLTYPRPQAFVLAVWPTLSALAALLLLFSGSVVGGLAGLLLAGLTVAAIVRIVHSSVVVSVDGIESRGLRRTQVLRWDQLHSVRAEPDGDGRAKLEALPSFGGSLLLWSGPDVGAALGDERDLDRLCTGPPPPPWWRRAVGSTARWLLGTIAVLAALLSAGFLLGTDSTPVDPDAVADQSELFVFVTSPTVPRISCPAPVSSLVAAPPPWCAAAVTDHTRSGAVLAAVAIGCWAALRWLRRRRERPPAPPGPISS